MFSSFKKKLNLIIRSKEGHKGILREEILVAMTISFENYTASISYSPIYV